MIFIYSDDFGKYYEDSSFFVSGKNYDLENDFVFSAEKKAKDAFCFKTGAFKFHNPQLNDVIILENIEIEKSERFFTRMSFDEFWELYIFLNDYPEINISVVVHPNKILAYTEQELIELSKLASKKIFSFLVYQNIDSSRVKSDVYSLINEEIQAPFYCNQPFWIEIRITKI